MSSQTNSTPLAGHTILVMDDDANVRELFKLNLERLGCDSISACNGIEAIEIYKQSLKNGKKISAIIMDLIIPGSMGGIELSEKLRALNTNLKMIVSSGHSEASEMIDYKNHGFDGAIEKNFDREVMKNVLEDVLLSD